MTMVTLVLQSESFACSFWGKNSIWGLCLLFLIWLKDGAQGGGTAWVPGMLPLTPMSRAVPWALLLSMQCS